MHLPWEFSGECFHRLNLVDGVGGEYHFSDAGVDGTAHRILAAAGCGGRRRKNYPFLGMTGPFLGEKFRAIEMGVTVDHRLENRTVGLTELIE